jgi:hypothetical protein
VPCVRGRSCRVALIGKRTAVRRRSDSSSRLTSRATQGPTILATASQPTSTSPLRMHEAISSSAVRNEPSEEFQ